MNIRALPGRGKRKLYRSVYLRDIDSVQRISTRRAEFGRVRDTIRQSGTDSLLAFDGGYTHEGGLSLQQNPDEFAALICFLKEYSEKNGQYINYMEIGSASGGACLLLNRELNIQNTLSLDDGSHPRAVEQKENFGQIENFRQFVGDSHSPAAREFLANNLEGKLDIAFIDGDHSYAGARDDYHLTLEFCRPGTLLIFHDTVACGGVEKVWLDAIVSKKVSALAEYIGEHRPLGIGVVGVL